MNILGRKVKLSSLFQGDPAIWMMMLILCLISILVIYSSTASMAYVKLDGNTMFYLSRQTMIVLISIGVAMIVQFIDYRIYYNYARILFYVSLGMLFMTFFAGAEYNSESRWLRFLGLTFQPSDIIKITLVILLSKELSRRQYNMSKLPILPPLNYKKFMANKDRSLRILRKVTLPLILPVAVSVIVIMISNLSTALIVGFTAFVLLMIGRVRVVELLRLILVAVVVLVLFIGTLKLLNVGRVDTWISRIENFVSGDDVQSQDINDMDQDTFQKYQAKIAVANGWLTGVGPGNSTQRSSLPHSYSDYAFALLIEEYGILGALIVIVLYFSLFYRSIMMLKRCKTAFPALLILGLSFTITIQAMLHMMVSVDVGPVTGQTLPLISWGGSSLLFTCISLGMIQGVVRQIGREEELDRLDDTRHKTFEEWEQIEFHEENIIDADHVLLTEDNDQESEFQGDESIEDIDGLLQKDRLTKALNEEKYQPVIIWEDKEDKDENNI